MLREILRFESILVIKCAYFYFDGLKIKWYQISIHFPLSYAYPSWRPKKVIDTFRSRDLRKLGSASWPPASSACLAPAGCPDEWLRCGWRQNKATGCGSNYVGCTCRWGHSPTTNEIRNFIHQSGFFTELRQLFVGIRLLLNEHKVWRDTFVVKSVID